MYSWFRCYDIQPHNGDTVLVTDGNHIWIATYNLKDDDFIPHWKYCGKITHWIPLPDLP